MTLNAWIVIAMLLLAVAAAFVWMAIITHRGINLFLVPEDDFSLAHVGLSEIAPIIAEAPPAAADDGLDTRLLKAWVGGQDSPFSMTQALAGIGMTPDRITPDLTTRAGVVLKEMGCRRLSKSKGRLYLPPPRENGKKYPFEDMLEGWVKQQRNPFTVTDAATALNFPDHCMTPASVTRIGCALRKMGCTRVEQRIGTQGTKTQRFYLPPTPMKTSS